MNRNLIILLLFVTMAMAGCSPDYESVADTAVTVPSVATETAQPTETAVATATATSTPEPTATPTLDPTAEIVTETAVTAPTIPTAVATDNGKVTLDGKVLLDIATEAPGCYTDILAEIAYAPTNEYFLVIPACIEQDNQLFLFRADGTGKQQITGPWDYLNVLNFTWADDGLSFTYERLNSCCLSPEDIPVDAPPVGLVQVDVLTGEKVLIATPTPRP